MDSQLKMDVDSGASSKLLNFKERKSTVSETFKYYTEVVNKLMKESKNPNEFLSSDIPLPLFEEKVRSSLINSLRLTNEVVKIFLNQDDYQISRALGFKWFFKNLPSEFCIKELFPFVSVSLRYKIINRLSKYLESSDEAEKYFEFIKDSYGNDRAIYLLPRCSSQFIWKYFEKTKHTFEHNNEVRILFNICRRYPDLGVQILSDIYEIKKTNGSSLFTYNKILMYLTGHYPDLMLPFLKKYYSYRPSHHFGIRLTKKYVPKFKKDLFPDLIKHISFKDRVMFSMLNNEEQVKYLASFVIGNNKNLKFDHWRNSSQRIINLVRTLPEEKRLEMIQSVFKEVYNLDFNSQSKCWTSGILEILPTATREPYLQKLHEFLERQEKEELDENVDGNSFNPEYPERFIYLYDSDTAFQKFKEILWKTPDAERRQNILPYWVKNCSVNDNLEALQKLVELIAVRHRNDDYNVISKFQKAIRTHFPFSKLNSVILEKMVDLIYYLTLKRQYNFKYTKWKELQIYYQLENNMEPDFNSFFQAIVLKSNYGEVFAKKLKTKHSRTFILGISEKILKWIRDNSDNPSHPIKLTSETLVTSLINTCKEYNIHNIHNRIAIKDVPGLEEVIKDLVKQRLTHLGGPDWPMDLWERAFTIRCVGNMVHSQHEERYLTYIVKRNPELIVKHLESILHDLIYAYFGHRNAFLTFLNMALSFKGATEKAKEIIIKMFKDADAAFRKHDILRLYSRMCTIEEFTAFIKDYLPKKEKVSHVDFEFDQMQLFIPNLIKNIKPRWKNFDLILKFYFGDFIKSVFSSFAASCYHTRCDFVVDFLKKQLSNAPPKISYKKNIIRLIVEVSDWKDRAEFFLKQWDQYTHYSVRSVLLFFILKWFLEQPSQESFRVLEKCILESDKTTIKTTEDLRKVPKEFFGDYVYALWRFSESQDKTFKNNYRMQILGGVNQENINCLPVEFCQTIIKYGLFQPFSNDNIYAFTSFYLGSNHETAERRVHFVFDFIKTKKPASRKFFNFIKILIAKSEKKRADFADVFALIIENWPEYPLGVLFELRLLLTYYSIYYKVVKQTSGPNKISVELGKELKTYFSKVEGLNDLVFKYAEVLKNFFNGFGTYKAILVVKKMVDGQSSPNRTLAILAILSLPQEAVDWHKTKAEIFYQEILKGKNHLKVILNAVEGCNDRVVDIYMRSKFDC